MLCISFQLIATENRPNSRITVNIVKKLDAKTLEFVLDFSALGLVKGICAYLSVGTLSRCLQREVQGGPS